MEHKDRFILSALHPELSMLNDPAHPNPFTLNMWGKKIVICIN